MKLKLMIYLFFIALIIDAQSIGNYQIAVSTSIQTASTPNTPVSYQWQEVTNKTQGIQVSVVPAERREISIQQTDSYINFNTFDWGIMVHLSVKYDNGNWNTIFNNQSKIETGWISNPFSSEGIHNIKVKWISISGTTYYRDYDVYVVKNYDKFYKDNYGNTLTCWSGNGNNNSIIVSEGFDAYNSSYEEFLYFKGQDLFEPLQLDGNNIYILNYQYNSQDMRNSAAIYSSAVNYIYNLTNHTKIIATGVSMGGVITRYALAKAEDNNAPLPVKTFLSIDAPQKGAVISKPLQDYMKSNDPSDFQKHGLNNTAAKQLLLYNSYGNLNTTFYNELNTLNNGLGYPSLTKNYGISFSSGYSNPHNGTWLSIKFKTIFGIIKTKSFSLTSAEQVSGSYLPITLVDTEPAPYNVFYIIGGLLSIDRTNQHPTFIPYESSLDIVNGLSNFDETIQSNSNNFHDSFPPDVVNALLNEFAPQSVSITPTINNAGSGRAGTYISGSFQVKNTGSVPLNLTIQCGFSVIEFIGETSTHYLEITLTPSQIYTINYKSSFGRFDYGPFTATVLIFSNAHNIHETHTIVGTRRLPDFCYCETKARSSSPEEQLFDGAFLGYFDFESDSIRDDKSKTLKERLSFAYDLLEKPKTEKVENICKMIIELYPESEMGISFYAIGLLSEAAYSDEAPDFNEKDFKEYLKSLTNQKLKYKINGYAQLLLSLIDVGKDIKGLEKLFSDYEYDQLEELSLFHQFIHYFVYEGNKETARKLSDKLDEMFSHSRYGYQAHLIFGDKGYTLEGLLDLVKKKQTSLLEKRAEIKTDILSELPSEYKLYNNYPNPFNPSTTIKYSVPAVSNIRLSVYNMMGQLIKTLVNETKAPGFYNVQWNGTNESNNIVTSGIYFYRFESGNFITNNKMILLK